MTPESDTHTAMSGIDLIAKERQRQIQEKGYTPDHDDWHINAQLAIAAMIYTDAAQIQARCHGALDSLESLPDYESWPFENSDWKPSTDPVRNLVKAGALICAEIDRLKRLEADE